MFAKLWISALPLFCLALTTNCVETQVQQWDHALDAFKRDVTESISTLFEGISKAMNTVDIAGNTTPNSKATVLHIIDKLSLKRLYRILAANNQLDGYTHEIVYWVPHEKRSDLVLRDISILNEVLSAKTVRILDLKNFNESEQEVLGSDRCSKTRCYDLLAAKAHELRRVESNITTEDQNYARDVWLLDIDMYWVGHLGSILEELTPTSNTRLPFSSRAAGDKDDASDETATITKSSAFDFLGACVGDGMMKKASLESSYESKNGIVHAYEKVLDDIEKLTTDATKALTGAAEAVSLLLLGNDYGTLDDQPQSAKSFCWPEIARFSTKFLRTLYRTTFSSDDGNVTVRPRGEDYWQMTTSNEMKYHNILDIGLKDGLLGKDFVWIASTANSDYSCRNCTEGVITETEFEMYKDQFLEQAAEPFVFEKKAGTLFRNIQCSSS